MVVLRGYELRNSKECGGDAGRLTFVVVAPQSRAVAWRACEFPGRNKHQLLPSPLPPFTLDILLTSLDFLHDGISDHHLYINLRTSCSRCCSRTCFQDVCKEQLPAEHTRLKSHCTCRCTLQAYFPTPRPTSLCYDDTRSEGGRHGIGMGVGWRVAGRYKATSRRRSLCHRPSIYFSGFTLQYIHSSLCTYRISVCSLFVL